ncbi:MAG: redoxin domain-containing protein, partial [Gemmatimonadetes bacterium]|nr:TlpA family protein disulfide reductase [Gemmatimonadota bacterium]NIQ58130.1 TlpA family protein disulfide reductase [Gemmatimonadota bacterium]NIU78334.1 redoxin domain-containing protein [Gammaproteobacteria bacterium]NIX47281.1 redoxin domain-containing protein [Gemmatimonadota bacterium]NIY11658.1 redoxin domain-containing protein [Gemmatimonadota bacterium]
VTAAVLGGLLFTALLGYGMTRDPRAIPSPLVDKAAPAFHLESLTGDSVSLATLRGQVTVINFWASWRLACRQEHPALVRAWRRYEEGGAPVRFLGIVYQDTRRNAVEYMRRPGGGWTNLLDPHTRTAIDFGVYGVPETYFPRPRRPHRAQARRTRERPAARPGDRAAARPPRGCLRLADPVAGDTVSPAGAHSGAGPARSPFRHAAAPRHAISRHEISTAGRARRYAG